jgi:propionate catabolism operon transcriptional regulator
VVAATNHDLEGRVAQGSFREDLYYRLAILRVHLPALAERREDLPLLAEHLLRAALARHGASLALGRALEAIESRLAVHSWPGNVRELENVVERVAVLFASADPPPDEELRSVVPELFGKRARRGESGDLRGMRRADERAHIHRILAQCDGNQVEAARRLGIGRTTLWRKLRGEA